MDNPFYVDVEAPNVDLVTIPLEQAVEEYLLDGSDISRLKAGETVWYRDTALTMHEKETGTE